ncbi:MAG: hypothetical protein WD135_00730, partial [Ferruginibacter sp.]
ILPQRIILQEKWCTRIKKIRCCCQPSWGGFEEILAGRKKCCSWFNNKALYQQTKSRLSGLIHTIGI